MTTVGTETPTVLRRHLDAQRRHVLGILDDLSDEQLARSVLPSGWCCLGMVKHLVFMERYWFRCVVGGESLDLLPPQDSEWRVDPGESAESVLAMYRRETELADEIIAVTGLDQPPAWPDPAWVEWGMDFPDLREVMLHVITETAVHAGHLDAARELIDRRQWLVLD